MLNSDLTVCLCVDSDFRQSHVFRFVFFLQVVSFHSLSVRLPKDDVLEKSDLREIKVRLSNFFLSNEKLYQAINARRNSIRSGFFFCLWPGTNNR